MVGAAHLICIVSPAKCLEFISCAKLSSPGCSLLASLQSRPQASRVRMCERRPVDPINADPSEQIDAFHSGSRFLDRAERLG